MEAPCAQYVPTTLLLIITYLTFYFALDDFTDRIMVSLTALMVMAALFLQTNQSMPRTAYLKVVDIWFLFCIIIKFVIVLWLVVINYVRQMEALRGGRQLGKKRRKPPRKGGMKRREGEEEEGGREEGRGRGGREGGRKGEEEEGGREGGRERKRREGGREEGRGRGRREGGKERKRRY
ncbi:hypothetical protein Pcinc_001022 [Petrolisthes cinctipes]|uniref:Neurotransmitter-gated ion-channel transmembrane domain-containing protein n=1 Tax=Petrolisthes cinctipes TaxID=88211 RepID=A0AAE1GNN5_PETCI|nr:hypothetical protein Pcinc_010370 [Petrolisthes cinctipes]KAK3895250.1 hypothetical protein Pcinc_001022 [Petrolisthes cinctipes]